MFVETPLGSKRKDRGPLSRRLLVRTVIDPYGPRAMHTCPSPCQGGLGFGNERRIWSGFGYAIGLARDPLNLAAWRMIYARGQMLVTESLSPCLLVDLYPGITRLVGCETAGD